MKFAHQVLATAFTIAAAGAQAQAPAPSKMYGEIGYAAVSLDATGGGETLKAGPGALTGVLGYQLHPNLAVEGFLGLGVVKDDFEFTGLNAKIKNTVGVFVKPGFMVSENVELFARLGYLRSKLKLSSGDGSVSYSDTGAAYGLGVNLNLSKTSYVQANWMSYYKEKAQGVTLKAQGVALAYGVRF